MTSGRDDVTYGLYADVLERYDVISGVSLLSPTTSGHFPVTYGFRLRHFRFLCRLRALSASERNAEKLMVHYGQYVNLMALVTERQSALPDPKPKPEMG